MKLRLAAVVAACLALGGCGNKQDIDKSAQYGPSPSLPDPSRGLLPRMNVPKVIGWSDGATPTVPQGFRIEAIATGLSNPRNVYPLDNGDLLIIESKKDAKEPVERPKRPVMAWIEAKAHGGSSEGAQSNRILLLRAAGGNSAPAAPTVLVDNLNSPFGVVVVGNALYVADTDAILRFPFTVGQAKVGGPGEKVVDLPAGVINHHWTKSLTASPDGSKLYVGVGSNSNAMERGLEAETNRAAIWEVDLKSGAHRIFASGLRNPNGLAWDPASGAL